MKKLFTLLAFTMICLSVEAQNTSNDDVAQKSTTTSYISKSHANSWRGFTDLSMGAFDGFGAQITGSYGYQFGNYFYLGAGLGLISKDAFSKVGLPLFVNPRVYFVKNGNVRPFVDAKLGYNFALTSSGSYFGGVYFSPAVGIETGRFSCSVSTPMISNSYGTSNSVMATVAFNF